MPAYSTEADIMPQCYIILKNMKIFSLTMSLTSHAPSSLLNEYFAQYFVNKNL
jgi:hypothetical protein